MTADLQRYAPSNGVADLHLQGNDSPANVVALMDWAQSAQAAYGVAQSLVRSSFVPAAFRGKPEEATAAILAGLEIGLNPMAALRAFDIIQNTAAPKAITLRAVVQSRGHEIWVHESTATRSIVKGRRAGSDRVQESVWDLDRARGLGLLGKDNWKKQPGAMLVARATSELCRLIASDAILGLPYTSEELADDAAGHEPQVPESGVSVPAPAQSTRRTAKRRAQPRPAQVAAPAVDAGAEDVAGPPLPGENGYEELTEHVHAEPGITKPQRDKIMAMFDEAGIKNREIRLEASRLIVRRLDLTSANDLTITEASTLIDELEGFAQSEVGLAGNITELLGRGNAEAGDPL